MVTDISFSKHARRQIGKYIKGTYHKQLSDALNKQIHIYSPQKLLKTLQQAKILPKLRQMLNVVLDNPPVTDLAAAKQIVKAFTDQIKPEDVVEKMQHATTNVQNVHRTRPFGAIEIHAKGISTRVKRLETALKSLALMYKIPDDSNVLSFMANAAAIFRKLNYKDPHGKKTPCKFKNVSAFNASTLKFPTIRELGAKCLKRELMSSSPTSFHKKMLLAKTYNSLVPFTHLAKNLVSNTS